MRGKQLVRALTIWSSMLDGRSRPIESFQYDGVTRKTIQRTLEALEQVPLFQVTHRWQDGKKLYRSDYKLRFDPITPKVKRCYLCLKVKDIDEFHKDRLKPDGRVAACKECRKQVNVDYRKAIPLSKRREYYRDRYRRRKQYKT